MTKDENQERRPSEAQLAANRANAQKSTGPRTDEGKAKSSNNALKHGIDANPLKVLPGESLEALQILKRDYMARLQPVDSLEDGFVIKMVDLDWQTRRMRGIEQALLEMAVTDPATDEGFAELTGGYRLAVAFSRASINQALARASQFLARLTRELARQLDIFLKLRKKCPPPAAPQPAAAAPEAPETENVKNTRNEPNPPSEETAQIVGTFVWKSNKPEVLKVMSAGQAFPDFV